MISDEAFARGGAHAKVRRDITADRETIRPVEPRGERVFSLAFGAVPVGLRAVEQSAVIDEFGV